MTDTPTLSSRLKEGQGADRELDREIALAFGWSTDRDIFGTFDLWSSGGAWDRESETVPPAFTADLNAVFALVERELPGWVLVTFTNGMLDPKYFIVKRLTRWKAVFAPVDADVSMSPMQAADWPTGLHPDPCRALLLALLAAKEDRP